MTSTNMMTSLAQNYSPHPVGMQQHPGMAGHQMGVPQNPGQPGQPGPGMSQQMHMGVSGPGHQVSQGGAMMGGMPPGAGGPSQHALSHLNPTQQQQMFQQQQQMAFSGPQLHQMQQQQQMIAHQRQQQARLLSQQYSGAIPMGMTNNMNQMTPAQFAAMRGGQMVRPVNVNLPQHLQAQQAQAEHSLHQQQQQQAAQAQAQQQHQHHQIQMAQQLAMQQQAAAQAQQNSHQPNPMIQQQAQSMQQQAQQAALQAQQQQQQAHAAGATQPNQAQSQAQAVPASLAQQAQPNNAQAQAQHAQQPQQAQQGMPPHQQAAMMQQRGDPMKERTQCLAQLKTFSDQLGNFGVTGIKQKDDLSYWLNFVKSFFSPKGVLRHSVFIVDENTNKQYEITYAALPRYFHTHFESGITRMQMIVEKGDERRLANTGGVYFESPKTSFIYWFDNGSQLVANGTLKAYFDADSKIELLDFETKQHEEYVPRSQVLNAARPWHEWQKEWKSLNSPPDGKQSPEMNKKKANKALKQPSQPPPDLELPDTKVKSNMGITPSVFQFLEFAEVIVQMNPLFNYYHQHESLSPYAALDQYVATVAAGNPGAQPQNPTGPRTPGIGNFPIGTSPAQAHLNLPAGSNSPHMGGSPAQGTGMQHQQSQHGTSSSGPSANTSPNASNKRRRPSGVKEEDTQINGAQKTTVKASPRVGGKRQKPNAA